MMYSFLANNRDELIERCKAKVALRPTRAATLEQLKNGVPIFLEQLERTLRAEEGGEDLESAKISGHSGGDASAQSEMGVSAIAHGKALLELGFTIDQVVHDYGDLCQAITDLAVERDAPFGVQEFRTLNRCLDNAIAEAVTEFSALRDASLARRQAEAFNERLGFLVHELRNSLLTASLAVAALQQSQLPISGATGGVLKRSIQEMKQLISAALDEVRVGGHPAAAPSRSRASWPRPLKPRNSTRKRRRRVSGWSRWTPRSRSPAAARCCSPRWGTCCRTPSSSRSPARW
ncbi:hypothetical protein [Ramlibacter montanisoli]|uniref:hypothetical protein n=1 Tax=Ramlibacter montanisoli TaxID=2732512 RepID=UPI002815B622|nr:hypothetical protein [Ramlibacter montanisoli]